MEYNIELAKGKWLWTKDIDLNKIYCWVNWPMSLWQHLFRTTNPVMKLVVWDTELPCFLWDSTTNVRLANNDKTLVQLMIDIPIVTVWALLVNDLKLIIN